MTWMRVDAALPRHPKVRVLAQSLSCRRAEAIGILVSLWAYAIEYHEDGDLSAAVWPAVAEEVGLPKTRGKRLREVLVEAGFMTSDGQLNSWEEYQGTLLNRREWDRHRKAEQRRRAKEKSAGRPTEVPPTSTRTSAPCPDRTNETNERTNDSRDGGDAHNRPTFSQPEHQSAYSGFLRAARNEAAVRASIAAVAEGMPGHGPGFGWPVVGQALLELAAAGSTFSEQGLRAFARKVRDRKPEPPTKVSDDLGRFRPAVRRGDRWHFTDAEGGSVEVVA